MPQGKRNSSADFGDILASFDRKVTKDIPTRSARKAEPEVEAGPDDAPRPKNLSPELATVDLKRIRRDFAN